MKSARRRVGWVGVIGILALAAGPLRGADRPLKPFAVPKDRAAWEAKRIEIRRDVGDALGELPPRPKDPIMETRPARPRRWAEVWIDDGPRRRVRGTILLPEEAGAGHRARRSSG